MYELEITIDGETIKVPMNTLHFGQKASLMSFLESDDDFNKVHDKAYSNFGFDTELKEHDYVKKPIPVKARKLVNISLVGGVQGNRGDYLVTGVQGEKYIVKGDIFEKTYIRVD